MPSTPLDVSPRSALFALAAADKLDASGMPRPLQLAVMVPEFEREIRPLSPPWPVLRVVAAILAPLAAIGRGRPHSLMRPAASRAHNSAAVALQRKNALRLLPSLRVSLRAQGSAGSALASLLRRPHVSGALDAAHSSVAIADVEQALARRGLATAELETEAGASLEAKRVDLIRVLAGRIG